MQNEREDEEGLQNGWTRLSADYLTGSIQDSGGYGICSECSQV